jgi:hypothetical protein
MPLQIWSYIFNAVILALLMAWIGNWTSGPVGRALRRTGKGLAEKWRDLRIDILAKRVNRLVRIQKTPAVGVAEIVMAVLVVMLGGGYVLMFLLAILYVRITQPHAAPDVTALLGGGALVITGCYRAIDAHAELLQTDRMLLKLRRRAEKRGWDLDDACAALR